MNELLIFWSLVLFLAVVLTVLRDVLHDDPRGAAYRPPRSHPGDDFTRSGSSWR